MPLPRPDLPPVSNLGNPYSAYGGPTTAPAPPSYIPSGWGQPPITGISIPDAEGRPQTSPVPVPPSVSGGPPQETVQYPTVALNPLGGGGGPGGGPSPYDWLGALQTGNMQSALQNLFGGTTYARSGLGETNERMWLEAMKDDQAMGLTGNRGVANRYFSGDSPPPQPEAQRHLNWIYNLPWNAPQGYVSALYNRLAHPPAFVPQAGRGIDPRIHPMAGHGVDPRVAPMAGRGIDPGIAPPAPPVPQHSAQVQHPLSLPSGAIPQPMFPPRPPPFAAPDHVFGDRFMQ
jgi:hypothetical protein